MTEFVLSLFEQVMGKGGIDAIQKSIVDLCNDLRKQSEPESVELATAMELFASGSHRKPI